jgi:CelD/BcsL family acetyltransferase involved in cellulose biosynthesis
MGWTFHSALENFSRYRDLWDEVNRSHGDHLVLDSLFVEPLVRQFASQKTLLAVCEDKGKPVVALLEPAMKGMWRTFQPSQAPLGLAVFGARDGIHLSQQIRGLMRALPGYALGLSFTQQDPDSSSFETLNGAFAAERLDYIETARLTVPKDWEEYWRSRSKNLTHNLLRQRRRLEEKGSKVELAAERDPKGVAVAIGGYARLENSGWKGKEGTAVSVDNAQGRFYRDMLERLCARNEGVIYSLLIDGKIVASDLCVERDGTMVILKTAYDEDEKGLSLGLLLHMEIFRTLSQEGRIHLIEFYGRVRDWHLKWTNDVRTMYHVNLYRHRLVPIMRHFLKKYLQE